MCHILFYYNKYYYVVININIMISFQTNLNFSYFGQEPTKVCGEFEDGFHGNPLLIE